MKYIDESSMIPLSCLSTVAGGLIGYGWGGTGQCTAIGAGYALGMMCLVYLMCLVGGWFKA